MYVCVLLVFCVPVSLFSYSWSYLTFLLCSLIYIFQTVFCVLGFCMCESDTQHLLYSSFTRAKAEQYTSGIREAAETGIEATCAHHRARHAQNVYLV